MSFDHTTFISPFTWRYGSAGMRRIWSETHRRRLMRRVWVALATAQHKAGLVTAEQLADLQSQVDNVDIDRALAIEQEARHDVMAEIRAFAEQCPTGGGIIHWGATSADVTDNVRSPKLSAKPAMTVHSPRVAQFATLDMAARGPGERAGLGGCLRDGRLLPFGWLRLLRGRRNARGARILTVAVARPCRHWGLGSVLYDEAARRLVERRYTHAGMSW